ncbi:Nitrogen regulation protein NR(I) [Maioricimonas rarisocia]|uniref:Nitrogen regulation protein NR(I) n=1 Tax=Maioricimonas rarisocia TaxID=2528026 RepID=A0A517Z4I6_9PLAN|nr:response regulator [Maioricimonas rarisocia]QDU37396.1 Nitrogen regulation protein NR(I) [Maioricimonas rarisocia]
MPQVLVVDDTQSARMDVIRALSVAGISAIEIPDARDASAAARHHQPDLILLDVMMPGVNGLGVLQQLRSDPRTSRIPVIVVSALADSNFIDDLMKEGAVACVAKPFGHAELRKTVQAALETEADPDHDRSSDAPGQVTAFIGAKGGVGTTTVAINVAATWADQGSKVSVTELRTATGTLAARLNRRAEWTLGSLLQAGRAGEYEIVNNLLVADECGLELLCGPQRPIPPEQMDPRLITGLVDILAARSRHVVLDLAGENSEANAAALAMSHSVVLVVEQELTSLVAARAVRDLLIEWRIAVPVGVVLVQHTPFTPQLPTQVIQAELECDVIGVIPPAADVLDTAVRAGLPLILSEPQHHAAVACRELSRQLVPIWPGVPGLERTNA